MNYTVDVIIPAYKPGPSFQELLDRLTRQTYPVRRILVINTEESLYPADQIRQPENMELYHITRDEFDHGTTRNRAAQMADSDLMLFMTQDALPADKHLVANLVAAFKDETVGAAYARQIAHRDHSLIERYTRQFNYPAKSFVKRSADLGRLGIKTFFCSDACAMYRRSLYLELGGFRPQAIFNEDMLFASELIYGGYGIAYQADARVIHSHDYTGMEQLKRNFDNGVSQALNPRVFADVPAYGEGMKLVKKTAICLIRHGEGKEVFRLIWLSACKMIGFSLGKSYFKLPKPLIMKLTSNKEYWTD
ncbi:MAG: glycosyltransferase family 2 protein [Lachnospiraceae bacterium]|nr:glycosyltransferase family 2 protein [Lachnospiraceae bacterium]